MGNWRTFIKPLLSLELWLSRPCQGLYFLKWLYQLKARTEDQSKWVELKRGVLILKTFDISGAATRSSVPARSKMLPISEDEFVVTYKDWDISNKSEYNDHFMDGGISFWDTYKYIQKTNLYACISKFIHFARSVRTNFRKSWLKNALKML